MKHFLLVFFIGMSFVTYAQDSTVVETKVFLIRHAEVEKDGTSNPPLSVNGIARSWKWASFLQSEQIDMVFSTDLKRTQATAHAIAENQGIETIISYDPNTVNFASFMEKVKGKTVLVVGHSNTTPIFVNQLIDEQKYGPINHNDYGNLFIVTRFSSKEISVVRLRID